MLSRLYKGDGWGGLISTANQKFQKKLRQISHDESPGGAAERSPARQCWGEPAIFVKKPRRGDTAATENCRTRVSPLRGLCPLDAEFPGLTPWATIFRAYGAVRRETCRLAGVCAPTNVACRQLRCYDSDRNEPELTEIFGFAGEPT
jgi:hypothetical protein